MRAAEWIVEAAKGGCREGGSVIVYVFSWGLWEGVLAGLPRFFVCLQGRRGIDDVRRGGYTISVWVRWHILGPKGPSNAHSVLLSAIEWSNRCQRSRGVQHDVVVAGKCG